LFLEYTYIDDSSLAGNCC